MGKGEKISLVLLSLTALTFIVSPAYSAYATIYEVFLSAPPSVSANREIQVQAAVVTKRSG